MFYKKYDELTANLTKTFRSKKTLSDTAFQFAELALSLDQKNPFEFNLVGLAKFGEMRCYEKLEDPQKLIRAAISAARFFIKSAKFNYEISQSLHDTWADPLSDGIHCYRSAILTLKATKKYNLACFTLNELAEAESFFNQHHNAGNAYEESSRLCAEHSLHPRIFIDSLLNCVECYTKSKRFDLALFTVMSFFVPLEVEYSNLIEQSSFLKNKMNELCGTKSLLFICNNQFSEALNVTETQIVDGEMRNLILKFSELIQSQNVPGIKVFIEEIKNNKRLSKYMLNIIERHYQSLEEKTTEKKS
ncbi:hypothetical protein M9Y10_009222 [Tritrichomonas musculus]|uniref:Uncharacterized protein n=1 Tax=Tritrichomonas musculus TaxID=1915356 RepID=A0ABR2IMP8_9EUKA